MAASPSDHIDRREALRRAALLLGGAISGPTLAALLAASDVEARPAFTATAALLDSTQAELIATIAEHIIPATDTPGARGAGVPRFIATMLAEYYTPAERERFLAGLADVDARARARNGRPFLRCTAAQQRALVVALDAETFGQLAARAGSRAAGSKAHTPSFFRTMKDLTVIGYYTSEPGATKELRYVQVPGRFDGCIPLAKIGRAWAV